jgi:hypothetical protein
MGPISRYLGPEVPSQQFSFQDPLPTVTYSPITAADETALKAQILAAQGLTCGLGFCLDLPRRRQARRCQRCPYCFAAPSFVGGEQPQPAEVCPVRRMSSPTSPYICRIYAVVETNHRI